MFEEVVRPNNANSRGDRISVAVGDVDVVGNQ